MIFHYPMIKCLMQLMCNYVAYVLWKYKAFQIKCHVKNSQFYDSHILLTKWIGLFSLNMPHMYNYGQHILILWASCTIIVKGKYLTINVWP
jgi:hypothetical protein